MNTHICLKLLRSRPERSSGKLTKICFVRVPRRGTWARDVRQQRIQHERGHDQDDAADQGHAPVAVVFDFLVDVSWQNETIQKLPEEKQKYGSQAEEQEKRGYLFALF